MAAPDLATAWVQIPNRSFNLNIDAYLAQPQTDGPSPAVIVFQEIFGVNAHIRNVTERIAQEGYVAIAPALYQRLAPGFETGYTPQDIELGRAYKVQTQAIELLSDIQATLDYLQTLPQVQHHSIGTIGFCFGGHVAYLAATLSAIKATASFYGAGIATSTPGSGPPTLTRTAEIKGKIYTFFGTQDTSIPPTEIQQIESALREYHIPHQIFCYPADHGFFCDQRASYQPEAAAAAWQHVRQLFATELRFRT